MSTVIVYLVCICCTHTHQVALLNSTVSGTICNNFGNFENLQGLFLEHNRLVGTIPKSIYRGSGLGANPMPLVQLFLEQNALSGTLHEGLATLPNLKELYVDGNKLTGTIPEALCMSELNSVFLYNDTQAARSCDGISCPANSASKEGVAPCTPCPNDGGFNRYIGQHDTACREGLSEVEILDLFFEQTHGDEWLKSSYIWEKGSPACQRRGVECNNRSQVTEISLPSLGLRGPLIPELMYLSMLEVIDLRHNHITGFLPSDLRFLPLKKLDIRGSRMQGVVPPLLCIKEGINGNGIEPYEGILFDLLYTCENIVCPRGTFSSIGRAVLPQNEGDGGTQCQPCYDDQAAFYLGRDHCTDYFIAGMQFRRDHVHRGLVIALPIVVALSLLATFRRMMVRRRGKLPVVRAAPQNGANNNEANGSSPPRQNSLASQLQLWSSTSHIDDDDDEDEYSDDDWTAGYSETEGRRPFKDAMKLEAVELSRIERTNSEYENRDVV